MVRPPRPTESIELPSPTFLEEFVDNGLLERDLRAKTDVGKAFADIVHSLREGDGVTIDDVEKLARADGSLLNSPSGFINHCEFAGQRYRALSKALHNKVERLDIPDPDTAYLHGLVHDLTAPIDQANMDAKELTWYVLARFHELHDIAEQTTMHAGYVEVLGYLLNSEHEAFGEKYDAWRKTMLDPESPWSEYRGDELFFTKEIHSVPVLLTNLPLLLITVVDYSEIGKPFNEDDLEDSFTDRINNITLRYFTDRAMAGEPTLPLGDALMDGAKDRANWYLRVIEDLLEGNVEPYAHIDEWKKE